MHKRNLLRITRNSRAGSSRCAQRTLPLRARKTDWAGQDDPLFVQCASGIPAPRNCAGRCPLRARSLSAPRLPPPVRPVPALCPSTGPRGKRPGRKLNPAQAWVQPTPGFNPQAPRGRPVRPLQSAPSARQARRASFPPAATAPVRFRWSGRKGRRTSRVSRFPAVPWAV